MNSQSIHLPKALATAVSSELAEWESGKTARLWARDATLWTGSDEAAWLGWLDIVDAERASITELQAFAADVEAAGFTDAVVLGMGGSSLCPEVLALTFGQLGTFPPLHVLDSTDPAQVAALAERIEVERTLFIVSSKSGSTLEPNIFLDYFYARVREALGDAAGQHFVAVTDPGSKLEALAVERRFRQVFHGVPAIGGRYSALSRFGLVPAAAMGIDVAAFLDHTAVMVAACRPETGAENPGVALGVTLGMLGRAGRDKVTIVASPAIYDLGAWLEQLIAESTGKLGTALIPVDRERLSTPDRYGDDRLFVDLRFEGDTAEESAVERLVVAGHPVIRIGVHSLERLAQEFFRWEIATAVAGAILEINPFDQPDVEASKVATRALTEAFERDGSLPSETPVWQGQGVALYTDAANAEALSPGSSASLTDIVKAHLDRIQRGDYFAVLAYVEMNEHHEGLLSELRHSVRDMRGVATCLGFGPRFLHSTGQAYKGGPPTGVFLQITAEPEADVDVPGRAYSFGVVEAAQARGDFDVLAERGRRALRVHLGVDVDAGLRTLIGAVNEALGASV